VLALRPLSKGRTYQFLLVAHIHLLIQLLLRASILVDTLFQQHRLDGRISKDDTRSKQTVDDCEEDLHCVALACLTCSATGHCLRHLFHLGTSNALTAISPAGSVHVPTGLNDILRCRESGLPSRLQGWYSSIVVKRSDSDMAGQRVISRRRNMFGFTRYHGTSRRERVTAPQFLSRELRLCVSGSNDKLAER
jgi:hypothetical protein